jgi:tetratricopeptide (TPR) repeat protein
MREDKATLAFSSIRKAVELAERNSNENEKALIMAMSSRYIQDYIYEERRVQDSLYALEMQKVYTAYPEDLDVATIYAEALFLLEPRRGHRAMDNPRLEKIHTVLEKVLAADIEHPGACHLYIHATESTPQPELGESCAAYLGDAIPGASHINHMPSHTYNEVGRWGESVKANLKAWHTDQKARMGRAFAIYPQHNLHMLLYAASYDGQGAIAIQAGKDFSKEWNNSMFHGLTLIRFGRFDEVLNIERPEGIVEGGIWDYCQGYALLKTGEPDFSMVYLQRVLATADTTNAYYRYFEGGPVLSVLGAILEGEIHQENSDINAAIRSFQRAVEMEDRLDYAEPEILPFSARHWLGNALLEAGQYHQAELVYREELVDHPHNGWSLFGLIESLKAQKILYDTEQDDFNSSWSRSDIWLRSSRF